MSAKKEPRLEFSVNWFDKWKINWSCNESTWKQVSEKLKSMAMGTSIAIGASGTIYSFQKIDRFLHPPVRPETIEAPFSKE